MVFTCWNGTYINLNYIYIITHECDYIAIVMLSMQVYAVLCMLYCLKGIIWYDSYFLLAVVVYNGPISSSSFFSSFTILLVSGHSSGYHGYQWQEHISDPWWTHNVLLIGIQLTHKFKLFHLLLLQLNY